MYLKNFISLLFYILIVLQTVILQLQVDERKGKHVSIDEDIIIQTCDTVFFKIFLSFKNKK